MNTKVVAWQKVALQAQEHRDATIVNVQPPIPLVPDANDLPLDVTRIPQQLLQDALSITNLCTEQILDKLATGQLSSVAVVTAFLQQAGLAQTLTNCVTELLPATALARAEQLDRHLAVHGTPIGPLHGLPISVKEHIGMADLRTHCSFVSWWDNIPDADAHVVQILHRAGCVFYARTTQPQTCMHLETASNLYGTTLNPFNRNLTAGGSSGGEGALLGLRGSCLGLGTDVGGSIRSPAANCGIFGLRPTSLRIPLDGCISTVEGEEYIPTVLGPLSTSLEGIKIFMRTIIATNPWLVEPAIVPIPWRDDMNYFPSGRLKVAVMWTDGIVHPHPPVDRALNDLVQALKQCPHIDVVDWKPYQHDRAWDITSGLYFPDGGEAETEAIAASGEPWLPLSSWIMHENANVKSLTTQELATRTAARDAYRSQYAKRWADSGIDVILCPAGPSAAPLLNHAKYWAYTSTWNLLDYPALVFPVTRADPSVDVVDPAFEPFSSADKENHALYSDPELYRGAPVGLQLVGRRYEDEKVIQALEFIQRETGVVFTATG